MTCPASYESTSWRVCDGMGHGRRGGAVGPPRDPFVKVGVAERTCQACPLQARCVRSPRTGSRTGWQLLLPPRADHAALAAARARCASPEGRTAYAARAGITGTVSQAVRAFGLRRARYRGLAKTHVQAVATATALDLARLDAWLARRPLGPTRVSRFAGLAA